MRQRLYLSCDVALSAHNICDFEGRVWLARSDNANKQGDEHECANVKKGKIGRPMLAYSSFRSCRRACTIIGGTGIVRNGKALFLLRVVQVLPGWAPVYGTCDPLDRRCVLK